MPTIKESKPGQSKIPSENDEKRECDVDNERMSEKARRGASDGKKKKEIFHWNLATLSRKIDEFVVQAREMWVERQKEEDKKDVNVDETTDKPAGAAAEEAVAKEKTNEALKVHKFVNHFTRLIEAKIVEGTANWRQAEGAEPPFLENVDRLHKLADALSPLGRSDQSTYAESFNRVNSVLHKAMMFTKGEFKSILKGIAARNQNLEASTSKTRQDSTDESSTGLEFPGYSSDQISDLNKLAHTMISTGYETECCQIYSIMRRDKFEECLIKMLSFQKRSIEETLKMDWEILKREMAFGSQTSGYALRSISPASVNLPNPSSPSTNTYPMPST